MDEGRGPGLLETGGGDAPRVSPRPGFSADELIRLFRQVPAIVWACDRDLRFTFGAGSALTQLGLLPNQLIGVPFEAYFGAGPAAHLIESEVRRALAGESVVYEIEWQGRSYETHVAPLYDGARKIEGAMGVAFDVTDRRAIEHELFLSRHFIEQTSKLFPIAHYSYDAHGKLQITDEYRRIYGLSADARIATADELLAFVHPDDRPHIAEVRRAAIERREPYSFECRIIRADGSMRHIRVNASVVFSEEGEPLRTIGTVMDTTEELERRHEIAELLRHDGITGLPNRQYFTERARREFELAAGGNELLALVLVDLDRFSRINDSLGHLAGDEYLRLIASRLRSFQKAPEELIARMGADEFAILLRGSTRRADLAHRIDQLRLALEEPATIDGSQLHVGVSMGVAMYPYDGTDPTLLQKADLALSRARSTGTGRTEFYDLILAEDAASSVRLEHALHEALKTPQIVPYYQPIVDSKRHVVGVEALVRWNHPQLGTLPPSFFLDLAEESGLIQEMGESVLRQACIDIAPLRKRNPSFRLNVNLSSRHLLSRRLLQSVEEILRGTGMPSEALQVEVTEQSLIEDVTAGRRAIDSLRDAGISVVIDDFGTGYNTLGYLKSYHVDGIKLDRVFIKDMLTDRYSRAICEGVMATARSLDLHVIAEGVETPPQADAALALGCGELQGFLFGKAMPFSALRRLLDSTAK